MKKTLLLACAALFALACGEDGKINLDTDLGKPAQGSKLVSRIVAEYFTGTDKTGGYTHDFAYDAYNRVVKITSPDNTAAVYQVVTFTYLPATFITRDEERYDTSSNGTPVYQTSVHVNTGLANSAGRIVSEAVVRNNTATGDNYTLTYDTAGNLAKMVNTWKDTDGVAQSYTANFTWAGGNMTNIATVGNSTGNTSVTYGTLDNNPLCNLDLNTLTLQDDWYPNRWAALLGLYGNRSAKMIGTVTYTDNFVPNATPVVDNLEYVTSNGFVTKITATAGQERTVYTITYK